MNIEALLRRSTRSRKPVERFDPSELAGASAKVRNVPKSRKARKVVPQKFYPATVSVPAAENWGGHDANDEFENLAKRMGRTNFGLGRNAGNPRPLSSWPPSGRR
jgi:hypothetical protein